MQVEGQGASYGGCRETASKFLLKVDDDDDVVVVVVVAVAVASAVLLEFE